MSRLARVVVPECPHHITQRGVRSMGIFSCDNERLEYLRLLKQKAELHGVRFLAYCLMTNHIHLIAIPPRTDSLARAIGEAHRLYTKSVNARLGVCGYLFQGRFYSCPMDTRHTVAAAAYMERNPVRTGMCAKAWEYPWSSARLHIGLLARDPLIDNNDFIETPESWRIFLEKEPAMQEGFRKNFRTGRPLGSPEFLAQAEHLTNRILRVQLPGRKKQVKNGEISIMSPH
ncbi:MAG: transposase [Elusimicrobia bacterium CG08_land_8_20_14_0_20_59_10]|nr:MAG: transposase [Elusimicrobia bacterium CG08_land_8_20_14_0_20_59_10]